MSRPLALVAVTIVVLAAAPAAMGVTYGYDDQHRLRSFSSASGIATLAYDRAGRLVAITGADGGVTTFAYDAAGKPSFVLPEVDDEVVVAFLPGDPREPYVLGLLWERTVPTAVASRSR